MRNVDALSKNQRVPQMGHFYIYNVQYLSDYIWQVLYIVDGHPLQENKNHSKYMYNA